MNDRPEVETQTAKIMNEILADIDKRFEYVVDYKENVGLDIPYSKTSEKYQEKIKDWVIRVKSKKSQKSYDDQKNLLEKSLVESAVTSYLEKHDKEQLKTYFELKKEKKQVSDAEKLGIIEAKEEKILNDTYNIIPIEEKNKSLDFFFDQQLAFEHANFKMKTEINQQFSTNDGYNTEILKEKENGYCLKAITVSLYEADKDHDCMDFLPYDIDNAAHPNTFIDELSKEEKFKKHVYSTDKDTSFGQIINDNNIQAGAIVIVNNQSGDPHHAVLYMGEKDKDGSPLLVGFNNEEKDIKAEVAKNGIIRQGTVIDIHSLVADGLNRKMQKEKMLSLMPDMEKYLNNVKEKHASLHHNTEQATDKTAAIVPNGNNNFGMQALKVRDSKLCK